MFQFVRTHFHFVSKPCRNWYMGPTNLWVGLPSSNKSSLDQNYIFSQTTRSLPLTIRTARAAIFKLYTRPLYTHVLYVIIIETAVDNKYK